MQENPTYIYAREAEDINTHKQTQGALTLLAGARCHFQTNSELINIHKYGSLHAATQRGERNAVHPFPFLTPFSVETVQVDTQEAIK